MSLQFNFVLLNVYKNLKLKCFTLSESVTELQHMDKQMDNHFTTSTPIDFSGRGIKRQEVRSTEGWTKQALNASGHSMMKV